jgi:hypothetical protein
VAIVTQFCRSCVDLIVCLGTVLTPCRSLMSWVEEVVIKYKT